MIRVRQDNMVKVTKVIREQKWKMVKVNLENDKSDKGNK